jgi:hypothetical protein
MGDFSDFTDLVPWMLGSSRKIRPAPKPFLRLEQPSQYSPSVALSLTPSPDDPRPKKRPPSPKNTDRIRPTSAPTKQPDPAPTDPAPTDPAPTDPASTDPVPTDPAPTEPQMQLFSIESVLLSEPPPEPAPEPPPEPAPEPAPDSPNRMDWLGRALAPLPEGVIFNLPSEIRPRGGHSRRSHPHFDDLEPYVHSRHPPSP